MHGGVNNVKSSADRLLDTIGYMQYAHLGNVQLGVEVELQSTGRGIVQSCLM